MKRLAALSGRQRRQHMKLLRRVRTRGTVWVRGEISFRQAERLHKAGLLVACISKWGFGSGRRLFRELALYPDEVSARVLGEPILPRG